MRFPIAYSRSIDIYRMFAYQLIVQISIVLL